MTKETTSRVLSSVLVVCLGVLFIGFVEMNNGVLTQIRTGTDILETGRVLHADPYSFTAHGHSWTDQSWLVELTYGIAAKLAGLRGVVIENMVAGILTLLVLVRLCWSLSPPRLVVAAGVPAGLLALQWGQRPIAFAILFFALTILIFEQKRSPWFLLPLGWLWVNSHGSFVMGIAWAIAFAIGEYIDTRARSKQTEKRVLALLAGVLLGGISPAGPSVLWFWTIPLGTRSEIFTASPDWTSPNFHSIGGLVLAAVFLCTLLIGCTYGKQWRHRIPVVGLAVVVLVSYRHMPFFAVALCPLLAVAIGNVHISDRVNSIFNSALPGLTAGAVVLAVTIVGTQATSPTRKYVENFPVETVEWLHEQSLLDGAHRIGGREVIGNVLEWKYGTKVQAFYDDRFDMYPKNVSIDVATLTAVLTDPAPILEKYNLDIYVTEADGPLDAYFQRSPDWKQIHQQQGWNTYQRVE